MCEKALQDYQAEQKPKFSWIVFRKDIRKQSNWKQKREKLKQIINF